MTIHWTSDIRKKRQKEVHEAMAHALLNPRKTQAEIAEDFGVTDRTLRTYKSILAEIFAGIAETSVDDLEEQDLDFLVDYKEFKPIIYNMRLSCLGWTQEQIGKIAGMTQGRVSQIIRNVNIHEINSFYSNGKTIDQIVEMMNLDIQTVWHYVLKDLVDDRRVQEQRRP